MQQAVKEATMAFQRYLAEEVAIDHADGALSRREALRRLAMLGLGVPAASALLAACGGDGGEPAPAATTGAAAAPPGPAVATQPVTFPGPQGRTVQGAWAAAAQPRGAVLVIHENRGLNDHIRSVAGRLAASGYSALAIDLLSAEGGTAALGDEAAAMAALSSAPRERLVADMRAGLDELERRATGRKLGAIGFCFGGGMVWLLLAAGEPRLAAAAPFYGPLPEGADLSGSRAAVLGVYAEQDQRVNASREAAAAALERAGLTHEIVTYPGANHAFFNDTGPRYHQEAATRAYAKVLDWFGSHLG
jgi:carboxymethylenebutenolidase